MSSGILGALHHLPEAVLPCVVPLILASLGGLFSERAGVINIGLEGLMTMGAFSSAVVAYECHSIWLGIVVAMVVGGIFSLLHAFASISLRANQIVSGVVLNMLGMSLAIFCCRFLYDDDENTPTLRDADRLLSSDFLPASFKDLPVVGGFFEVKDFGLYLAFLLVPIACFALYRTSWGLRLRSIGENPYAAASAGISVQGMRYVGVILSGVLAGLGGAFLATVVTKHFQDSTVAGAGFMALAVLIFGKWRPVGILLASLFFGSMVGLRNIGTTFWSMPPDFLSMLPYLLTLLALAGFVGRTEPPKAIGVAYNPEKR